MSGGRRIWLADRVHSPTATRPTHLR